MSSSTWRLEAFGRIRLAWAERPPAAIERLHPDERRWLDRAPRTPERRADWIAGRLGLALLIDAPVLADEDGAPAVVGWAASIAHDDGWVAVAARPSPGRIGIDLVPDRLAPSAARALARTRASGEAGDPGSSWAAIECAAKMRAVGIAPLLDRPVHLCRRGDLVRVDGLGRPVLVWLRRLPGAVLALADEVP